MGYERKRGKLAEFNALLRGGSRECFSDDRRRDLRFCRTVKYVITLDTDTQLPRDAARQLVGTMAHPLNRPRVRSGARDRHRRLRHPAAARRRQPARAPADPGLSGLFAGDAGIDPYTRAVSDVYQDVFQEGSFIGKGIYDVDAFERALAGRFPGKHHPEPRFAGSRVTRAPPWSATWSCTRTIPSRYNVDIGRRHRWIRGDWQIAPWLLPRVPGAGRSAGSPIRSRALVAVEDFRQPAAQPGPGGVAALAVRRAGCSVPQLGGLGRPWCSRSSSLPGLLAVDVRFVPQADAKCRG